MGRFVLVVLLVAAACGKSDDGGATCVAGQTVSCGCLGSSSGVQTCLADGTYGVCQCGATIDAAGGGRADAGDGEECGDMPLSRPEMIMLSGYWGLQTPGETMPSIACPATDCAAQTPTYCPTEPPRCNLLCNAGTCEARSTMIDLAKRSVTTSVATLNTTVASASFVVTMNTLSADVPTIEFYIGPVGAETYDAPGVEYLGSTGRLIAGAETTLEIGLDAAAKLLLDQWLTTREDDARVIFPVVSYTVQAGDVVPVGDFYGTFHVDGCWTPAP